LCKFSKFGVSLSIFGGKIQIYLLLFVVVATSLKEKKKRIMMMSPSIFAIILGGDFLN
jgi:hypothetical protein